MRSIGVALSARHTPKRSNISRLPCESAIGRGSADTARGVRASMSPTRRSVPRSASAAAAPTGPPPTINPSKSGVTGRHPGFDIGDSFRGIVGGHFGSVIGHRHIVLDANADTRKALGNTVTRPDIAAWFDREHHAGLERAPFA